MPNFLGKYELKFIIDFKLKRKKKSFTKINKLFDDCNFSRTTFSFVKLIDFIQANIYF